MNPETGHLVDLEYERFKEATEKGYLTLPEEMNHAAKCKLNGRPEANVSLTSGGKLSRWASNARKNLRKYEAAKKSKNRRRNKIAKKSRKKNR